LAESCELAKKVKIELEKQLEEAQQDKVKLESNYQEKMIELETLKTENERVHAEHASFSQVLLFYFGRSQIEPSLNAFY